MPRVSYRLRKAVSVVSRSRIPNVLGNDDAVMQIFDLADNRAFPVNMRAAISDCSLNDAVMIGYMRGIHDCAQTVKRETPSHNHKRGE